MANESSFAYDIHPGIVQAQKAIDTIERRTGRTVDEWIAISREEGPESEWKLCQWLESTHRLGETEAWWIAGRSFGTIEEATVTAFHLRQIPPYVEALFAGERAILRPACDRLVSLARAMGEDVRVCPARGTITLFRRRAFAQIHTRIYNSNTSHLTYLILGLALGDTPPNDCLFATRGYARSHGITHCLRIATLDEIDAEVEGYLAVAYRRGNLPLSPPRGQRTIT